MASQAKACVTLGALAAVIGVIMGVVFMLNEEFVVATMLCNPDVVGASSNDSICEDDLITINGETCFIGNLGLYQSDYTPECLAETPFAITSLIPSGQAPTTEFGVLFPAQTGFSGIASSLNIDLEFESCASFYDDPTADFIVEELAVEGAKDGFANPVTGLPPAIKAGWDEEVDGNFALIDALLFAGVGASLISDTDGQCGLPVYPANVNDAYNGEATFAEGLRLLVDASVPFTNCSGISVEFATAIQTAALLLVSAVEIGDDVVPTGTVVAAADIGLNFGNTFGDNPFPAPLTGVDSAGLFAPFNSSILCQTLGGSCTYAEYIRFQNATLTTFRDEIELAAAVVDAIVAGASPATETDLENDAISTQNFNLAAQIQATKDFVDINEVLPTGDLIGAPAVASGSAGYAFMCPGVGLTESCTFREFLIATEADLATGDAEDQLAAQDLQGLIDILNGCVGYYNPPISSSDGTMVNCTELALRGPLTPSSVIEALYDDVYGLFYSGVATDGSLDAVADSKAAAEAECEDDELDLAAISTAQVRFPAGMGLTTLGLLLAVLNLAFFSGSRISRWVGIAAGVFSIIGLALASSALLGVYNAPIYASLGLPEGETPDGVIVYSSGIGFTYVIVSLAGAALGAILITVGGCLLKSEDPAVNIMTKA